MDSIPDASSPSVKTTTQEDAPEKHDFFFANNFTASSTSPDEASSVSSSLSEEDKDENVVVSVLNSYDDDDDDDDDEIYVGISIDNSIPDDSTSSTIPKMNMTSTRSSSRSEVVNSNTPLERRLSRRQLFQTGAVSALMFGGIWGKELLTQAPEQPPPPTKPAMKPPPLPKLPATSNADANRNQPLPKPVSSSASSATVGKNATLSTSSSQPKTQTKAAGSQTKEVSSQGRIETVNLTQVAKETNINITLECNSGCISVDSKNFTKTRAAKVPKWLPSFLTPSPQVVKIYQNEELLIASTVAGAATEMVRTSLLYPLQTIKTRIQTDPHNFTMRAPPIEKKVAILGTNIRRYAKEGNLYAGITPTLLAAVPATGLYFGVRDVTKRMLNMFQMEDIVVTLTAAFVADVVSLVFRTPADALALRLQAQNDDGGGDWLGDSLKRLPVVIATDFPYLLTKICINRLFIHGSISIDQYTEFAILSAVVAALLTTPFDVARTRILVDSDGDFSNGKDGGSGESLFQTMKKLTQEGDGGIQNLFAGWLERVLYLGIGRAWLEPIQIIGYVGIRDTLLLRWF